MQRPFSELKKVLYSGTDLIYCEPEEVKELYKKSRTYSIPIELSKADLQEKIPPLQQGPVHYPSPDPPMFHITGEYTLAWIIHGVAVKVAESHIVTVF